MLKDYLTLANKTFNGFLHRCPYQKIELTNVTVSMGKNSDGESIFPNGENKFRIQFYNNKDRNIMLLEFCMLKDVRFKD